ncbi:hypothetical protein, partial [Stutzerimonas nitrititolerans]|uniref:hypothetical protein n=1 Tax=Stutzerimonas nitrititolerans TaxID=2482751 RepID=UPI0028A15588
GWKTAKRFPRSQHITQTPANMVADRTRRVDEAAPSSTLPLNAAACGPVGWKTAKRFPRSQHITQTPGQHGRRPNPTRG